MDAGLRNAVVMRSLLPQFSPDEMGKRLENAVYSHLHLFAEIANGRVYYWRDGRREVDFVVQSPDVLWAIEITYAKAKEKNKGLEFFRRQFHPQVDLELTKEKSILFLLLIGSFMRAVSGAPEFGLPNQKRTIP